MKDKHIDIGNCIESLEAAQEMYNNAADIETLLRAIKIMDVASRRVTTILMNDGNMDFILQMTLENMRD
jgi:hypothetical protein